MLRPALVLPLLLSVRFVAAQSPVAGPVEGFTFDAPSKNFRAVTGTLGSALLSGAILDAVDFGSVAPGQDYGIAFHAGSASIISGLKSDGPGMQDLSGSFSLPDGIVWSSDGTIAILYSRSQNWLQVIGGLPASPLVKPQVSLDRLGGSLSIVGSTGHGERIFAGIAAGAAGPASGVYELTSDQDLVPVLPLVNPLALSADGDSLYALEGADHQIYQLSLISLVSQSWSSGLLDPVGLIAGRDAANRQVLYAAGRADKTLVTYDAASHDVVNQTTLDFEPTAINALGPHSFILRDRQGEQEPLWTFSNATEPTAYFVPTAPTRVLRQPRIFPRFRPTARGGAE